MVWSVFTQITKGAAVSYKPITYEEMVEKLKKYISGHYPQSRLVDPDYRKTSFYSSQWHQMGSTTYWRMRLGQVIAARTWNESEQFYFDAEGIDLDKLA